MIYPKALAATWLQDPANCNLVIAQAAGIPASLNGWFTNSNSSCVGRAANWAINKLRANAVLEPLWTKWFQPAFCGEPPSLSSGQLDVQDFAGLLLINAAVAVLTLTMRLIELRFGGKPSSQQVDESEAGKVQIMELGLEAVENSNQSVTKSGGNGNLNKPQTLPRS